MKQHYFKKILIAFGVLLLSIASNAQSIPELLYYKFDGAGTSVPNMASAPPLGTGTATIMGGITQGGSGKCGGALIGSGISATTDYLNTGWATNLTGTSWTISFWSSNITPSATLFYIFGDLGAGSFRCFTNGVAGANNWILRGGFTDVLISGGATVAPHMNTYVYDMALGNIKAYLDGVLVNTVAQAGPTINGAGPFKVMGYSANVGAPVGGLLDEFRVYNHALTAAQVMNLFTSVTASATLLTVCAGSPTTLSATGASSYVWNPGNIAGNNIVVNPLTTTTYTVTGNDAGCGATATVTITVNAPTVTASASSNPICAGASTTLTGGGAVSYVWSGGVSDGVPFTPVATTTYTVTGTDGGGCTATSTITITVNPLPNITANVTPGNSVVENTSVTLYGGGGASYVWNGPIVVSDNVPFNATLAADGIYTVTGTDGNGCTATSTLDLNVILGGFTVSSLIWGASPFQDSLWAIDTTTWQVVNYILPTLNGFTITGITGMAFDPCEFKTYAILKVSGVLGRVLATIDLPTGVCTQVGGFGTGGNFSSLTFRKDGQLFGATGNGATAPYIPEALYLINKTNAATTLATTLGAGADGEIICYNQADDMIYHWSGNGTVVMEKFPANAPYTPVTNIPIVGTPGGETFGALSLNPSTFIVSNISSNILHCSTTGVYGNSVMNTPDDLRGLVMPPKFGTDVDSLCAKDTLFAASAAAQWYTVYYSWGDGTIDTVIGNAGASHVYLSSGTKILNVILNNGTCTPDTFWSKTIFVKNIPVVTITGNNGFCVGDSVLLTGTPGGTSQWYFNGVAIPAAVTNTLFVNQVGNYNMVKTNVNGCADSAGTGAYINVNPLPVVGASILPNVTCTNTSVFPDATGATSYTWTGAVTNAMNFIANATTTYTVTGTDGNGCTATTTTMLTVNPMSGTLAPATTNQSQDQGDDFNINYYDASCDLIATVDDGAGGNILGLTTSTVNVDATAGFHNGQPYVRRWYQITPTSNGAADVILYFNQSDFNDYNAAVLAPYLPLPTSGNNGDPNIANIRITKNADAGLGNSPIVITPTVNWNGTYWELSFNTPSFSQFRVHSVNPGNVPLPATVTNFSGMKLETSDKLSWTTGSEQNNAYFNLQHSTDGTNFSTIAKVNSKAPNGNSAATINYTSINTEPKLGHNYYRLQQVDLDNKTSVHAQIVDLIWGANGNTVSIYPNPTTDILNIDLYAQTAQNTTVKLLDMSGRLIKQIQAKSAVGMNNIKLSMGEIASGVYTVQVYENNTLSHTSKVKKN